jgi:hypothetical protein
MRLGSKQSEKFMKKGRHRITNGQYQLITIPQTLAVSKRALENSQKCWSCTLTLALCNKYRLPSSRTSYKRAKVLKYGLQIVPEEMDER